MLWHFELDMKSNGTPAAAVPCSRVSTATSVDSPQVCLKTGMHHIKPNEVHIRNDCKWRVFWIKARDIRAAAAATDRD